MRRWLLLLTLASCSRSAAPCEPWKAWQLTALSDAPGERIERCTATTLEWRVMPGGAREAWLHNLETMPIEGGWRLWRRSVLVRSEAPGVRVEVRNDGADLLITLTPEQSIDVAKLLKEVSRE
ncbi:MAG: hypothetical protein ABTQ32_21580 [Myxococcaceae bacterium]